MLAHVCVAHIITQLSDNIDEYIQIHRAKLIVSSTIG